MAAAVVGASAVVAMSAPPPTAGEVADRDLQPLLGKEALLHRHYRQAGYRRKILRKTRLQHLGTCATGRKA
jgi:hypothetical protein